MSSIVLDYREPKPELKIEELDAGIDVVTFAVGIDGGFIDWPALPEIDLTAEGIVIKASTLCRRQYEAWVDDLQANHRALVEEQVEAAELKREPGFYWVRMIDCYEPVVAEFSDMGHWYLCGVSIAEDVEPEVLSARLEPPTLAVQSESESVGDQPKRFGDTPQTLGDRWWLINQVTNSKL